MLLHLHFISMRHLYLVRLLGPFPVSSLALPASRISTGVAIASLLPGSGHVTPATNEEGLQRIPLIVLCHTFGSKPFRTIKIERPVASVGARPQRGCIGTSLRALRVRWIGVLRIASPPFLGQYSVSCGLTLRAMRDQANHFSTVRNFASFGFHDSISRPWILWPSLSVPQSAVMTATVSRALCTHCAAPSGLPTPPD